MKPHVLLIEPMMPEAEAQLDAAYCVHRLFAVRDRAALIAAIGSSVRAIVTGGAHGAKNDDPDVLTEDCQSAAKFAPGSACKNSTPIHTLPTAASIKGNATPSFISTSSFSTTQHNGMPDPGLIATPAPDGARFGEL